MLTPEQLEVILYQYEYEVESISIRDAEGKNKQELRLILKFESKEDLMSAIFQAYDTITENK